MQTASEQIEAAERFLNAGELENAEVVFRELIKRTPEECEVHYKLGMVLFRRGDLAAAEAAYRDALRLHPYHPEVANALGLLLSQSKSPDGVAIKQEAESMFRIALGERPDYCDAHVNFANLLSDASRLTEARYHYLRALDSQPENALVLHNLGSGYRKSDRPLEAIAVLEKSLALNPGRADSWNELGVAYLSLSKVEEAIRYFRRADQEQPNRLPALKNIALVLNYIGADKAQVFQDHLRLGEAMRNAVAVDKAATRQLYPIPDPAKRLRIGFVTGDFREHVVSYFMLSFLRALNHRDFEYHVFHTSGQEDARSEQFRTVLHRWHRVHGMPAAELAETIAAQRIDILIDLSGHTTHSRTEVFALRPAPVQMAWIGYPNTSGLTEIDYRISDIWADPPGVDDEFHTETLLRMQRCFLCYSPPANTPEVVAAPCNRNGYITFGSFNRRTKISEECIALWAKVLRATPDSRLRLKSIYGFGSDDLRAEFIDSFAKHGVERERIQLLTTEASMSSHLERYEEIDIALDTLPYCGTTTTCESLWMGVPVVTLAGDRHVARVGVSLLTNAGLPELVAETTDEYVQIAAALAADRPRLNELRASLRERLRNSPLLDAKGMAHEVERLWRDAWHRYCSTATGDARGYDGQAISSGSEPLRVRLGGDVGCEGWTQVCLDSGGEMSVLRASLGDLSVFEDDSCAEIYCAHRVQRLPTAEVLGALQEMYRILQPGGRLLISVPDLETLAQMVVQEDLSRPAQFHAMRQLFGMQVDEFDFNKTGLNFDFLTDMLQDLGFRNVEHVESFGLFDDVSESRLNGVLVSLNLIAEK